MCNLVTVSGSTFLRTFEAATHKHVWWLRIQKIFTGARRGVKMLIEFCFYLFVTPI
jgi:hypothetical protein